MLTIYQKVTTESGTVYYYDIRQAPTSPSNSSNPVWKLQAHDKSASAFDVNPTVPGFFVTGSSDKQVKLWSVQPNGSGGPSMVTTRDLGIGRVFSANFAPDQGMGFMLAAAGSKGALQIWDTSTNAAVRRAFAHRASGAGALTRDENVGEKLISLQDGRESEDEDGAGEGGVSIGDEENGEENGWESMEE